MKILVFDMYGVIIEESKGNFTPYVYSRFPNTDKAWYRSVYENASKGIIDSDRFFRTLGFDDPDAVKRDYIENHLTLDPAFTPFADEFGAKFDFALLSNDVLAWSEYIREFYGIGKYFREAVISANTGCRKPDSTIFEIALERLGVSANDCLFIDNSVANLRVAAEVGMDTVLFNRDGEKYDGKTVNSFAELTEMLKEGKNE